MAAALEQEVALAEGARGAEQRLGPQRDRVAAAASVERGLDGRHASESTRVGRSIAARDRSRGQGRYSTPFADGAPAFFGSAVPMRSRCVVDADAAGTPPRARRRAGPAGSGRRRSRCRPGPRPRRRPGSPARRRARSRRRSRRPGSHGLGRLVDDPQRHRLDRRAAAGRRRCCRAAAVPRPARRRSPTGC